MNFAEMETQFGEFSYPSLAATTQRNYDNLFAQLRNYWDKSIGDIEIAEATADDIK